jgi:hypothetical protein
MLYRNPKIKFSKCDKKTNWFEDNIKTHKKKMIVSPDSDLSSNESHFFIEAARNIYPLTLHSLTRQTSILSLSLSTLEGAL